MMLEGKLDSLPLPEVLHAIALQGKTGILTVQGENDIIAVSFEEGEVVAADALNQTVEEGLGQVLASQGLVSPEDFGEVATEHEAGGKRLLDLLVERGHLDRAALLEALRLQTYYLLLQLLRWRQGEFKFYGGDEVAFEEGFHPIPVPELLLRALQDLGEEAHLAGEAPDLDLAYRRTAADVSIRVFGEDDETVADDPSALWLGPDERDLLERLDGELTPRELTSGVPDREAGVRYSLYRMLQAGVVERVPPRAPSPPPPPARPLAPPAELVAPSPAPSPGVSELPSRPPAVEEPEEPEEPESSPLPAPPSRPRRRRRTSSVAVALLGLVAAGGAVGLLYAAYMQPRQLLLPTALLQEVRGSLARNQRIASYRKIDRAARTFFLLEGRYPDQPEELVERRLLGPEDLRDPSRRSIAYRADDVSYELQPLERGEPVPGLGAQEAITGDFLLDPDFLALPPERDQLPLVLLD